jgi:DNA adenine methylase
MLNPPIPRMGGKSRLRKTIIAMVPEHTCYVELFFGAGWVYFGKKLSKVEVINDIDNELINLFRMIKYHAPEIERMLEYEFSGRSIFEEYKNCSIEYLTEINRAVRFLYLISQSFASRGGVCGYGTTTKPKPQIFYKDKLSKLERSYNKMSQESKDYYQHKRDMVQSILG